MFKNWGGGGGGVGGGGGGGGAVYARDPAHSFQTGPRQ
jgi:hypothetical protein